MEKLLNDYRILGTGMKNKYLSVIILFLSNLGVWALDEGDLAERSEFWPVYIRTTEEISLPESERKIRAGKRIVLIRVEGNQAIVDTGRSGVLNIDLQKTDILKHARAIESGNVEKRSGNLVSMIGNKFFDPASESLRGIDLESYIGVERFLICYIDLSDEASVAFIHRLKAFYAEHKVEYSSFEFLMIPVNADRASVVEFVKRHEIQWPVMIPFLVQGYVKALHHIPERFPCLVFVDPDGKILDHSSWNYSENSPGSTLKKFAYDLEPSSQKN